MSSLFSKRLANYLPDRKRCTTYRSPIKTVTALGKCIYIKKQSNISGNILIDHYLNLAGTLQNCNLGNNLQSGERKSGRTL